MRTGAGEFIHTFGDAHLYSNHMEQAELQLSRETKTSTMNINPKIKNIFDFTIDDFELINYDPHPHIKGLVAEHGKNNYFRAGLVGSVRSTTLQNLMKHLRRHQSNALDKLAKRY